MNVITIIECAYGMPGPDRYIKQICDILGVGVNHIKTRIHYRELHCFIIDDVDRNVYYRNSNSIEQIFMEIYNSKMIRYFYIGEYDNKDSLEKLDTLVEM